MASHFMKKSLVLVSLFTAIISLTGCLNTAAYDPAAYNEIVSLKQETLTLMGKATEPYANHEADVRSLSEKLNTAFVNAQNRANNERSVSQWGILIDEDSNLVGGFLKRWKDQGTLSKLFISEAKDIVAQSYDTIATLEEGKIRK